MHELSLAQNIIEIVRQHIPNDLEYGIKAVKVKVGDCSGVVPESLEFCFKTLTLGTMLEKSQLIIEHIPFVIQCHNCQSSSSNEVGLAICTYCGSTNTVIVSGTELQVVEIEIQEAVDESI